MFGIDANRLGIAGDSAGGTLAAAIAIRARDTSGPPISFQFLICPILDLHGESAARRELADGFFLDRATLRRDLELYAPGPVNLSDPRLSPLLTPDLSGLPPAFIHTGQFDPFSDEGEAYAARLADAGVAVHGKTHAGMIHYFYCMPRMIPYTHQAMQVIGAELRYAVQLPQLMDRRAQNRTRPELIRA
jgi:acetyl esterase/lipase